MESHFEHSQGFISKDVLDTANSLSWFLADALWMFGFHQFSLVLMSFTILTGLWLIPLDRRPTVIFINCGINAWIFMNTFWIISELEAFPEFKNYSKFAFVLGILFIALAVMTSKNIRETFSHFRRFRVLNWLKQPGR